MDMMRLQTFGRVYARADEGSRRVTSVVSTGEIARDGAIIEQSGWDLKHYEQNPVVLWVHNDRELPIAKTVESRIEKDSLVQVHEFFDHPRAEEVFQLVQNGGINATSVRWLPGAYEFRKMPVKGREMEVLVFTKGHQLLETSYVPIPADPGALIKRADDGPLDISMFRTQSPSPAKPRRNWNMVAGAIGRALKEGN